jgi:hypothetical protein
VSKETDLVFVNFPRAVETARYAEKVEKEEYDKAEANCAGEISLAITNARDIGRFSCQYSFSDNTRDLFNPYKKSAFESTIEWRLKQLGYKIKYSGGDGLIPFVTISWDVDAGERIGSDAR